MRKLHGPNYSNTRKYSAQDNAERIEAEREMDLLVNESEAAAREYEAKCVAREPVIVNGLVSKYGFSQKGAEATLRHIKNNTLADAKFATPEMKEAALAALRFYCSK